MKKSTKIIASFAATFVLIASIATVSLFKTDDSQVVPTTLPTVGTTLLPTQPLETVSAFDWEAYLNSQELSSETELSTEDPTATTAPVPVTSPNIIIFYIGTAICFLSVLHETDHTIFHVKGLSFQKRIGCISETNPHEYHHSPGNHGKKRNDSDSHCRIFRNGQ